MTSSEMLSEENKADKIEKQPLIWFNVITTYALHLGLLYALLTLEYTQVCWQTYLFGFLLHIANNIGTWAGVHRLWAHRSYKAKWPLTLILLICYSLSPSNSIYDWVRNHRVHHKFTDTVADPHNAKRSFYFSHIGWLLEKKHPKVIEELHKVDMSDILADPLIRFHLKHFVLIIHIFSYVIPVSTCVFCWNESWFNAIVCMALLRPTLTLNATFAINSLSHYWGNKPYNREIRAAENSFVTWVTGGEGWHNYHHCFPWDYKASEIGPKTFDCTTFFIEMFEKIGWAYDLKTATPGIIHRFAKHKGDGSHYKWGNSKQ